MVTIARHTARGCYCKERGARVIVRQPLQIATILEQAPILAQEWAAERQARQQRTQADPADYERLRQLGVHLMAVPIELGGTWEN